MKGIYQIRNLVNGKVYIGSTTESFKRRWFHHESCLKNGTHKNKHLQSAYNKYGKENFVFEVMETLEDAILEREQYYLDTIDNKYNINLRATSGVHLTSEELAKRNASIKRSNNPKRFKPGNKPWNKGIPHSEDMRNKLRKAAKKRKISSEGRASLSKAARKRRPEVYVYLPSGEYLGKWDCITALAKASENYDFILQDYVQCQKKARVTPPHRLKQQNINNVCTGRTEQYKGLVFSYSGPEEQSSEETPDEFRETHRNNGQS